MLMVGLHSYEIIMFLGSAADSEQQNVEETKPDCWY